MENVSECVFVVFALDVNFVVGVQKKNTSRGEAKEEKKKKKQIQEFYHSLFWFSAIQFLLIFFIV